MFQRFTVSTIITFIAIWSSKQMNARAQCLSTIRQEFDVSSFTEWETVCPDGKETAGTFTTSTSNAYCYITKPCIKIVGTGGSVSDVYIEKTLRTSLWKEITISFETYTRSLDTSDEFKLRIECGFIETVCDEDAAERITFNENTEADYSGCITFDVSACDTFTVRIGGSLSGVFDYVYVTYVGIDYESSNSSCLSTIREEFDVGSLTEWETVCPDESTSCEGQITTTGTSNAYCYITKPCIKIIGSGGSVSDVYIEKTLDTSLWTEITISFAAYTRSMDTSDECGFIETVCDEDAAERTTFNEKTTADYSGCITFDVSTCDTFTVRIGGSLSGSLDYVYVTYVGIDYEEICLSTVRKEFDVSSFDEWEKVYPEIYGTEEEETLFSVKDKSDYCHITNPCIQIRGGWADVQKTFYIEKTLDTSAWQQITISFEAYTRLLDMDTSDEFGFIETVCDDDAAERITFNENTEADYSGCITLLVFGCDAFTIRIGGRLSGTGDYVYITYVAIDYDEINYLIDDATTPPLDVEVVTFPEEICLSTVRKEFDVSSFDEWEKVYPEIYGTEEEETLFSVKDKSDYLVSKNITNPCIQIRGGWTWTNVPLTFYIETTLDTSAWQQITISFEAYTRSLDTSGEFGFIKTVCDDDAAERITFNENTEADYSGCITFDVSACDTFTIRIGGRLSGTGDYVYITYVAIDYDPPVPPFIDDATTPPLDEEVVTFPAQVVHYKADISTNTQYDSNQLSLAFSAAVIVIMFVSAVMSYHIIAIVNKKKI
eukprot:425286_1